jgi:hypothetical protein
MTEGLDRNSQAYAEALVKAQLRLTTKARAKPASFYEYVMREETERTRIRTLPHQRLLFEFVMAHERCVVRLPVGGSKTYTMTALTLFLLGEDPTGRGAIISASQGMSAKPLALCRDYLERSAELRAVFPKLRPSQREGDPWTQTAITVDRPFGIRDPSLVAIGVDGAIPGSRLNWCLVDDIMTLENTTTPESRAHIRDWFTVAVMSRLDAKGSRLVVTNTPMVGPTSSDEGDLTYYLESRGWPTLTITVWGDVYIANAPDFDSAEIRPAEECAGPEGKHRLVAHDHPAIIAETYRLSGLGEPPDLNRDVEELVTFWPSKFNRPHVEKLKHDTPARAFSQNYEMKAKGESEERIKEGWIKQAKTDGQRLGHVGFVACLDDLRQRLALGQGAIVLESAQGSPSGQVYGAPANESQLIIATGVDLAIGKKKTNARTVLFTIAVLPPANRRLILDIEAGRWTGREIVQKIIAKHYAYGSIVRVENNAAQDFLLQWTRDEDVSVPIRAHTTGRNKADPTNGVESLFIEIEQGGWIFPCDAAGKSPPALEAWLQDARQYAPGVHTGDYMMAAWLADWQAKKMGGNRKGNRTPLASLGYR